MLGNDRSSGSVVNTGSFPAEMGVAIWQMAVSAAKAPVIQLSRDLGSWEPCSEEGRPDGRYSEAAIYAHSEKD